MPRKRYPVEVVLQSTFEISPIIVEIEMLGKSHDFAFGSASVTATLPERQELSLDLDVPANPRVELARYRTYRQKVIPILAYVSYVDFRIPVQHPIRIPTSTIGNLPGKWNTITARERADRPSH